ncbi:MAG: O-antigen ligase family protein [Hyphomonadaceae bacterium]
MNARGPGLSGFLPRTLAGWGRAVFLTLTPPAAIGGGLALAPALSLAGLLAVRPKQILGALRNASAPLILLIAFAAWVAVSAMWSPYDDKSQVWRLLLVAGPGAAFLLSAQRDRAQAARAAGLAILLSFALLAALLAVEALSNMMLNRLFQPYAEGWRLMRNPGRGATVLVMLVWPVLVAVLALPEPWRTALATLVLFVTGALATQFDQAANLIAFLLGALAFLAALWRPRIVLTGLASLLALLMLTAPFAALGAAAAFGGADGLPATVAHRLEIWRFAAGEALNSPIIGHGLDASRTYDQTIALGGETVPLLPLHPHNLSLQLWLETGVIGAALVAAALIWGAVRSARRSLARVDAAALAGALAAGALIAHFSYGAWQEWWVATIIGAAGLLMRLRTPNGA